MLYQRFCDGLNRRGELLPLDEDVSSLLKSKNTDYYVSLFQYSENNFKQFKDTGSIAGIRDTTTNVLYWDFDSEADLEASRNDANELVASLLKYFPQDAIAIHFTGNKGFSVEVHMDTRITREEFINITFALADSLPTFDKVVNDSNRLIRIPRTMHPKSHLYKIPLTIEELADTPSEVIKTYAKNYAHNDGIQYSIGAMPAMFRKLSRPKETPKLQVVTEESFDLDFKHKPKGFTNCKWALLNGVFNEGLRSNAMMAIAATCKALGYPKMTTYYMCKGAAKLQSERTGQKEYPKEELWTKNIEQVYGDRWTGAQYSCKTTPWLTEICQSLGHNKCKHEGEGFLESSEVFDVFKQYATNIDSNTIKFGIKSLDDNMRMTTSQMMGILGAPASGKCLGKNTPIRMFDGSIKLVQDISQGDTLMGDDSTPRNVISTCSGKEPLYKIKQDYGDDYVVNESHILSLKCGASMRSPKLAKKYIRGKISDMDVRSYLGSSKKFKKYYKGYKVGVEYLDKPVSLDPYILGYWLGNGTSCKPAFSVHKDHKEVLDSISLFGKVLNLKVTTRAEPQSKALSLYLGGAKGHVNAFTKELRKYNVFNNKHIPKNYLLNHSQVRLQVLAGLMDSDGHYDKKSNSYEITFKSKKFADNTVELVRSLGFRATLTEKIYTWNSFTKGKRYSGSGLYYRLYIGGESLDTIPVKLPYKKARHRASLTNSLFSHIKLESLGLGDYYGFEIDGNKRFLLADFTVTHNTSLALNILNNTSIQGLPSLFLSLDMAGPILYQKLAHKVTGYNQTRLFDAFKGGDKKEQERIQNLVEHNFSNVKFSFRSGWSIETIRQAVLDYQESKSTKLKLLLIDYAECLVGPYSDATANSAYNANALKDLTNDLDLATILLVQPQKQAGDASVPLLSMRNVKGSSMLEQAFSLLLGIYREGFSPVNVDDDRYLTINCLKNRMGGLFSLDYTWDGLRGTIGEISEEEHTALVELRKRKVAASMKDSETW